MTAKDRRPYIVVTTDFFEHPKTLRLSKPARLHILELWAYANRHRTDGEIPEAVLNGAGAKIARELLEVGFIERKEDGSAWCHDYLEHQKSRGEIEAHVEKKRARQSEGGRYAMHERWHVKRQILKPGCQFCDQDLPPGDPEESH